SADHFALPLGNNYFVWSHHFVVLMLRNVAVPDKPKPLARVNRRPSGEIESGNNAVDEAGQCVDDIVSGRGRLVRGRRHWWSGESQGARAEVSVDVEGLAVQDLELDHVDVDRVSVFGRVDQLPDLDASELRVFGDWIMPALLIQQGDDRKAVRFPVGFGQGKLPDADRRTRIENRERNKVRRQRTPVWTRKRPVYLEQHYVGDYVVVAVRERCWRVVQQDEGFAHQAREVDNDVGPRGVRHRQSI